MHRIAIALLLGWAGSLPAEEVLILHPGTAAGSIDASRLKDLFLGRTLNWDNGQAVIIVVPRGSAADRLHTRIGRSATQFQATWKKLIFSGMALAPTLVDNDSAAVELVARTPGAIALVDRAATTAQVRIAPVP